MSSLIDEEGRLFGRLNVIDTLAILVIITLIVTGYAYVTAPPASITEVSTGTDATFKATVDPAVSAKLTPGREAQGLIVTDIKDREEHRSWPDGVLETNIRILFTAHVTTTTITDTNQVYWERASESRRLLIGETYRIDFGIFVVNATLIDSSEREVTS